MEKKNKLHLLWRSGFGPNIDSLKDLDTLTKEQLWEKVKRNSSTKAETLQSTSSFVQHNYDKITDPRLSKVEKDDWNRRIRLQSAKDLKELNSLWINRMINSDNQLLEKMSFFWHHHFAIRHPNSFLQQDAINVIRQNALGNFGDLLRQVSKSGAMILSLNNQQNKQSSPNENFAREIMELFAMGIGHYSENDIKEAARAFTGWSISREGRFIFKSEHHDTGIKNVLGERGNFNGDDVVDIILKQPQTARFIVTKLYKFLVNETVDQNRVEQLAASFRKDYQILNLLDRIFSSLWFYEERNIASNVKSPIELLVGVQRLSPFASIDPLLQLSLQKLLGQVLFHPPSIAGWPTGKNWIDSSTLMVRLQLPQILNGTTAINLKAKSDDDANMGRENPDDAIRIQRQDEVRTDHKWETWATSMDISQIVSTVFVADVTKEKMTLLQVKEAPTKTEFTYGLMSLPEYQLC